MIFSDEIGVFCFLLQTFCAKLRWIGLITYHMRCLQKNELEKWNYKKMIYLCTEINY